MVYRAENYIHEMDRKAFAVLNTFPKFVKLCEAYSANIDEKAAKIDFLSSAIRLNENQMPEVYNLLPPICEKLGIEVPELYYLKSKEINAGTVGTSTPSIYVTSALVEKVPAELIASILAHECGHIACKHYLYHSIVRNLIKKVDNSPVGEMFVVRRYLTPGLVNAFMFWDRCSELSADRAAVLCDGNPENTVDALLMIEGYEDINKEEFVKQAFDLRDFVNDSKSNKSIEQMVVQGESHPRLATRVYECYQWSESQAFKDILAGTYEASTYEQVQEEVISGEVSLEESKNVTIPLANPVNMSEIDAALDRVNKELIKYTNNADRFDYAYAVMSGIWAGVIDAMFVGQASFNGSEIGLSHQQINNFIQQYAKTRGLGGDRLNECIRDLEQAFKVAQDNTWKGAGIGVSAKNHHLADLAHHPTPIGLISSLIVQFLRIGTFVNKDGEWHFKFVKTDIKDLVEFIAPAIITGILNWLVAIGEKKLEEETGEQIPEALVRIAHVVASTPVLIEIAKCADNWFGHLVSDMGGSKNTAGGGMGIPGVFISLLYEIASLPILKDSGLLAFVNDLYENKKIDLRHEVSLYKELGKQTIPVIFNEIYVRFGYFLLRLVDEMVDNNGFKTINWSNVVPFGNRTVDRMLTVASMTFTMADTADAAVHAAIESCGNWILFSGSFVSRFNYVAAGRVAFAIIKEVSNEQKEAQLIHEKLLLTEAKTVGVIEQFNAYRAELESRISNYLAEDIEQFLSGFDYMKQGFATGNSDLVIKGNVTIQRVLGRTPQFTNQQEFDEFMSSGTALVL